MNLLHIDSSILAGRSVSRELSALIVRRLTADQADVKVTYRDVAADDLAHVNSVTIPSAHPLSAAAGHLDAAGEQQRRNSDVILKEFQEADTIVIGVPMYNFTIPSQLKAWVDRIIVPGTTFRNGPSGPEGLAGGKRVIAAIARGGFYGQETAMASAEHAETYMKLVFGFIGIKNVEFVLAEGLSRGDGNRAKAIASAQAAIQQVAA